MTSDQLPQRGLVTLFTVPFTSALEDRELADLARAVDLPARCGAEAGPRESRFGPARLDHSSGLFLRRDGAVGHWVLEGRTWGHPAAESVHGWHVMAAQAAQRLDATVSSPERRPSDSSGIIDRSVGYAAGRRRPAPWRSRPPS